MEHRKFLQRLDELVSELTHAPCAEGDAALRRRRGDEVQRIGPATMTTAKPAMRLAPH